MVFEFNKGVQQERISVSHSGWPPTMMSRQQRHPTKPTSSPVERWCQHLWQDFASHCRLWPKTVVREGSPWHLLKFFCLCWKVLWWLEITTLRKYMASVRKASSLVSGPILRCVLPGKRRETHPAIYRNPADILVACMQAMFHLVQWNFKRTHVFNMQSFAPNSQLESFWNSMNFLWMLWWSIVVHHDQLTTRTTSYIMYKSKPIPRRNADEGGIPEWNWWPQAEAPTI